MTGALDHLLPSKFEIPKKNAGRVWKASKLEAVGSTGVDHPEKTYGDSLEYYNQGSYLQCQYEHTILEPMATLYAQNSVSESADAGPEAS